MNRPTHRRGAVLVAVLVCLGVLLSMSVSMVAGTAHRRLLLSEQARVRQAELLIESAARRAAARYESDPTYEGETWRPRVRTAPVALDAEVVLRLTQPTSGRPVVEVTAIYPSGVANAVRRSDAIPLNLSRILTEEPVE